MSRDRFYDAKFDANGEVREGWSFLAYVEEITRHIPKTPSPIHEMRTAERCGDPVMRGGTCGRPADHPGKCIAAAAWERTKARQRERYAAMVSAAWPLSVLCQCWRGDVRSLRCAS